MCCLFSITTGYTYVRTYVYMQEYVHNLIVYYLFVSPMRYLTIEVNDKDEKHSKIYQG